MRNKFILIIIISLSWTATAFENAALYVNPRLQLPVGPATIEDVVLYSTGGSLGVGGIFDFPGPFFLSAALDMDLLYTRSEEFLITLAPHAGGGIAFSPLTFLSLEIGAGAGLAMGIFDGETGLSLYVKADGNIIFKVNRFLELGAGGGFNSALGLSQSLGINLYSRIKLGGDRVNIKSGIRTIRLLPVFPVLHTYYDSHPFGEATFQNLEQRAIEQVTVSLFVPDYMNEPNIIGSFDKLAKNEQVNIPLTGLFTKDILRITEATRTPINFLIEFNYRGNRYKLTHTETLRLYGRNTITWEDDLRIAAFISPRSPQVLQFARELAGIIRESGGKDFNIPFCTAVGILEALAAYGVHYVADPRTPYADYSTTTTATDYLQFASQTLQFKAGDCDDLTILFCSLLESAGISTAFITVPEHIFMAVNLEMTPGKALGMFAYPEDLIFLNDQTWLPVEVTNLHESFLSAWKTGAREWRNHNDTGTARLCSVAQAWQKYEPVNFIDNDFILPDPDRKMFIAQYSDSLSGIIDRELTNLRKILWSKYGDDPGTFHNKMGIVLARYGQLADAEKEFKKALLLDHPHGYVNLANIYFLEKKYSLAVAHYQKALILYPDLLSARLALAIIYYEEDERDKALEQFSIIKNSNSNLAEKHAYLELPAGEGTGRAAQNNPKEIIVWQEEK